MTGTRGLHDLSTLEPCGVERSYDLCMPTDSPSGHSEDTS